VDVFTLISVESSLMVISFIPVTLVKGCTLCCIQKHVLRDVVANVTVRFALGVYVQSAKLTLRLLGC
jgi:hypothetical protein